jgi:endothelin-converting enzyme
VIDKLVPEISFTAALKASIPTGYQVKSVLNSDSEYLEKISKIIKETPRDVLHGYFQVRLIAAWSGRLGKEYRRPLSIFGNLMAGRDPWSESERWRTCLNEVDGSLGWILSAAFVERAFSANAKALGDRIVKDIKAVFTERLKTFEWMSATTKLVAEKKGMTCQGGASHDTKS